VLAVLCVGLAIRDSNAARRGVMGVLSVLWLWMAAAYHWAFFAEINPAAWIFGAAFAVQAGLFALAALRGWARDEAAPSWSRRLGLALIAYALVVYPVLGQLSDHAFPRSPTFGLPCPTTIFTFGMLLVVAGPPPRWLVILPALWAVVGSTAAFELGILEDLGLAVAALAGVTGLFARAHAYRPASRPARPALGRS
jgi:hypothetical protein